MRILGVGAGPAGLYFALLMRKAFPDVSVRLLERHQMGETYGWGVVFSADTLKGFAAADPATDRAIRDALVAWTDIDVYRGGTCVRSKGHDFAGLSRRSLLSILEARCQSLGVEVEHGAEVADPETLRRQADLLLGCDGANSLVRERYAAHLRPVVTLGACRFSWLGTTLPLTAFTFWFKETPHGPFQVHAYPFAEGLSTFIVECEEEVWRRAGLEQAGEEETKQFVQDLFADELRGHPILTNRSLWRRFPEVRCARWSFENVCLLGDAAHTAHFSIGSGTKLAMEDAAALASAFLAHGTANVARVLQAYETERRDAVERLQGAAATSQAWFENAGRYRAQSDLRFTFNLMVRSHRITYDNLARRDPELVERVSADFARPLAPAVAGTGAVPPPCFVPMALRGLELENRIVVSPMCQYSAVDGAPTDWHLVHLGSLAVGGAGLVMTEMTNVSASARITRGCTGLYSNAQEEAWARILSFIRSHSRAHVGLQLGHAGRKGSCSLPWEGDRPLPSPDGWPTLAPSAIPYAPDWPSPVAMDRAAMDEVIDAYQQATRRAHRLDFDLLEIHMAHGYLLSSFLSPLANVRGDAYGGSPENRVRFPLEVFEAVRAIWPASKPISVRITATDWLDGQGGQTIDDTVVYARRLADAGVDLVDVSSGGNDPRSTPSYGRLYQVPFADRIRHELGIPVMAVGGIYGWDHVNTVLAAGWADLCALARPHLLNPHLSLAAAAFYRQQNAAWPSPYLPARPPPLAPEERRRRLRGGRGAL